MPAPLEVNWSSLSPASKETIKLIVVRLAAGYSYDEIATALQRDPPQIRHLPQPPRGVYSKSWVAARSRDLRAEIEERGAATY